MLFIFNFLNDFINLLSYSALAALIREIVWSFNDSSPLFEDDSLSPENY